MNWVDRIGQYEVEKKESPRPGGQPYLPLSNPRSFVIHTTEGNTVSGAWNTLNDKGAAPHFIVGEDRIVQCRPLSAQAATLVQHNDIGWQVESVGHADLDEHNLTPATWEPLVALTRFMNVEMGVPLRRPDGWGDQLPPGTWANNNPRRQSGIALTFHGLVGHVDVPDQSPTWHWDPGSLDYSALIDQAGEEEMTPEQKEKLDLAYKYVNQLIEELASAGPIAAAKETATKLDRPGPVGPEGPPGPRGPAGDNAVLEPGTKLVVE